ncbi:hypothetical protein [Prochlorococcus marinus]|uniref:Uncharacterized protein n=1 Tax=Prochlorococcus marinus XMU1408 TaxID=2213228 RepID=A0A318R6T0_PROMR|nr:hypothetical protein [Prochlorococcus marinus]MBW3041093.1 hypothetical protein [Prochlorococcus marinus str. XMU1408]PYE03697.1 hypothetical protein DNJ73_00470 [Prochlorococcus marinus XMU1408]
MLSTSSRLRIQEILCRIAMRKEVTLEERIYINKYASRYSNVSAWLRKASNLQRQKLSSNPIDELLNGLDLCSSDPHATYNPDHDDLGEWFSGSPSWVRRS